MKSLFFPLFLEAQILLFALFSRFFISISSIVMAKGHATFRSARKHRHGTKGAGRIWGGGLLFRVPPPRGYALAWDIRSTFLV